MLQLRHLYFFHHEFPGRTKRLILNHILRDQLVLSFHLQVRKVMAQIRGGTYPKPQVVRSRNADFLMLVQDPFHYISLSQNVWMCKVLYTHTDTRAHAHTFMYMYMHIYVGESQTNLESYVCYAILLKILLWSLLEYHQHNLWIKQSCVYFLNTFTELGLCFRVGKVRTEFIKNWKFGLWWVFKCGSLTSID